MNSHPAITDEEGVRGLMKAVFGHEGWPTLAAALKIQALCFARPGETRSMEWSELQLEKKKWVVPAEKAKMRRAHDVPLSSQALDIIDGVRCLPIVHDIDCGDIAGFVRVIGPDVYRLDRDGDGVGCE